MTRSAQLVFPLALAACSADVIAVDLPEPDGMQTLLVGIEQDEVLRVTSFDLREPLANRTLPSGNGAARLYALYYRRTVDELGYPPGELRPEPDPGVAVPLEDFDRAFSRDVADGEAPGEWQTMATSAAALPFRIAPPPVSLAHCPSFEVQTFELNTPERFSAVVPDGDGVLAFGRLGRTVRVTPNGVTELTTPPEAFDVRSAALAPNGDLWLGSGTRVLRGHPERGFSIAYEHDRQDVMQWMSSAETDREEVFVLTLGGSLLQRNGRGWREVATFDGLETDDRFGDVVWVGADEAAALPASSDTYVSYAGGSYQETFSDQTIFGRLGTVTKTGDGRVVFIAINGLVLEAEDGALLQAGKHLARNVHAAAPALNGFIYASSGMIPVYAEIDKAGCEGEAIEALRSLIAIEVVTVGNRVYIFGADNDQNDVGPENAAVMIVTLTSKS